MGWCEEERVEAVRAMPPEVDRGRDDLERATNRGDGHAFEE